MVEVVLVLVQWMTVLLNDGLHFEMKSCSHQPVLQPEVPYLFLEEHIVLGELIPNCLLEMANHRLPL